MCRKERSMMCFGCLFMVLGGGLRFRACECSGGPPCQQTWPTGYIGPAASQPAPPLRSSPLLPLSHPTQQAGRVVGSQEVHVQVWQIIYFIIAVAPSGVPHVYLKNIWKWVLVFLYIISLGIHFILFHQFPASRQMLDYVVIACFYHIMQSLCIFVNSEWCCSE